MNLLTQTRTMAAYNRWMNGRLYATCGLLPDAQRKRDLKAFFHSIHGTLNHLLLADRVWMARFGGQIYKIKSLDQELYGDFEVLRVEREQTDADIEGWAGRLTEADFASELSYTSIVNPQARKLPFWLAVAHFFNHQTHHRGQVTTLLSQSGLDPGVTDLMWVPRS